MANISNQEEVEFPNFSSVSTSYSANIGCFGLRGKVCSFNMG